MRKHRLLIVSLIVAVIGGFSVNWYVVQPTPGVTEGNLQLLRFGLSESDVAAILGSPGAFKGRVATLAEEFTIREWRDATVLRAVFDNQGTLVLAGIVVSEKPPFSAEEPQVEHLPIYQESVLDKVLRWLWRRMAGV